MAPLLLLETNSATLWENVFINMKNILRKYLFQEYKKSGSPLGNFN